MQVLNRRAMQRTRDRRLLQAPALAPAPANASGVTLAPGYFSPVAEVLPAPGMAVPPGAGSPGKALSAFPGLLVLGNKSIAGNSSSGPLLLSSDLPDAPIPPFIVPPPTATVCACLSSCMLCCDLQSPWWVMLVEQQRYSSQCFASAHSKVPAAQTKPSVACNVSTLEVPEFSHKMWLHAICEKNCLNFGRISYCRCSAVATTPRTPHSPPREGRTLDAVAVHRATAALRRALPSARARGTIVSSLSPCQRSSLHSPSASGLHSFTLPGELLIFNLSWRTPLVVTLQ